MAVGVPISFTVSLRGCYKAPERLQVSKNYSIDITKAHGFSLQRVKWVDDCQKKTALKCCCVICVASEGAERTHSNIFDGNHKAAIRSIIFYVLILCLIFCFCCSVSSLLAYLNLQTSHLPLLMSSSHILAHIRDDCGDALHRAHQHLYFNDTFSRTNFLRLRQSIRDFQRCGKGGGNWITYCIEVSYFLSVWPAIPFCKCQRLRELSNTVAQT